MRPMWSTERKILGGFSVALLVLCLMAGVSVWLTLHLLADLKAVSEQNDILSKIAQANEILPQLATTARLYGASQTDSTYREFEEQEKKFEDKLDEVDHLIGDSPTQLERMATVRRMLEERVKITRPGTSKETLEEVWGIKDGISQMRPTGDLLLGMAKEERGELGRQNLTATAEAQAAFWAIGLAGLVAVVVVVVAAVVILRDLKGRRKAAEELDRARQAAEAASVAKSSFLANMSHELRTPLTSIMGYVDLLLEPVAGGAGAGNGSTSAGGGQRQEYLQTMRRSGEHLLSLISDILDVSKIEAGRMTVEAVECRPVDIFADVESLMRSRATEKGVAYQVEYQTAIPERVKTDPTRFRQILMNLVGNAVKFTDEGSVRVLVNVREDFTSHKPGHRVVVEVVDTGVGISAAQQRMLFQPFTQADISTTRRFGGTGLGLSISRRLAVMLGGDLTVRSELGKGSTFRLSLPMETVEGAGVLPPGEAREVVSSLHRSMEGKPTALGLRVLLAEDGPENRDVITLHLRHAGCEATAAEDGQQAYDMAMMAQRNGDAFDVILMDMQMRVMDGYTATSKLRADGYTGVIIALTAHAMKEDRQRCLRVGCDEYATKPVNVPGLLQMMARFSGRMGAPSVAQQMLENPVLRQLTRKFVDGIPATTTALRELAARGAWEELAVGSHRLSGAGGAYGFDEITREAKALERTARGGNAGEVEEGIARLEQACADAQARVADVGEPADAVKVVLQAQRA